MNELTKWFTGTSLIGFIAVFALHGEAFLNAVGALPALIAAFSANFPFGLKSFALSFALAALVFSYIRRSCACKLRREFISEGMALCTALAVTLLQQYLDPSFDSKAPSVLLSAVWVGLLAGLGAPFVVRGMMSVTRRPKSPPPQ